MRLFSRFISIVVLSFAFLSSAIAHEYEVGDLLISHPIIPLPAKGSPVSAGYVEIHNNGTEDEVLLNVSSSFSKKSQIHTMIVVDEIAKMRPVKDGIVIPAGGMVKLEQGGLHFMFLKLSEKLEKGQLKDVVLMFKNAGDIRVGMIVVEQTSHADHSSHSDHSTD